MTISDPKVGGWASHEVLTSAQMNSIRTELLKAIDGVGGGSYSPSADLIFGGAFEIKVDSTLRVRTGGDLIVDSGGAFTFAGNGSVTGDVDYTGDLTYDAAGTSFYDFGHPITYGSLSDLLVDANEPLYRVDMTGVHVVDSGSGPTWSSTGTAAWTQDVLSASAIVNFPFRVLAGDEIIAIAVTLNGPAGHGGVLPTDVPRIRLMESASLSGTWSSVFSFDDPSVIATYENEHTLVIENANEAALPYVALNRLYRLEIRGENGGSAQTGLTLGAIAATIRRNQLVSTNIM